MSLISIKDETGTYIKIPRDKIKFESEEAEILYDLSLENDYLQKENQELKLELSGYRQAILNDKEMLGLKEENQSLKKQLEESDFKIANLTMDKIELKKQLEEVEEMHKDMARFALDNEGKIDMLNNQQKEFIDYLENELKSWTEALNEEHDYKLVQEFALKCNIYQEILSKYKSIIGVYDENSKN